MDFVATFSRWVSDPAQTFEVICPSEEVRVYVAQQSNYLVKAPNIQAARNYALKFERLEVVSGEGLEVLQSVREATEADESLTPLSIYEEYLPKRRESCVTA